MAVRHSDPVAGLYRTLLIFAGVGIVILAAGLAEFAYFEPVNPSGLHVHIVGVFHYDPATQQTSGPDERTFRRADQFAAVVDWSGLPNTVVVQAVWFDSFQNIVGSAGPNVPSEMAGDRSIPAAVPRDLKFHLPGEYIFAVERVVAGQPVEVLARRIVEVERT
ncbi:MAG TPA: hypothetical protein VKU84_07475 [Stellaceae bacterium]|nr:hypothetical protein [Stellaceae bacterium]